MTDPKVIVQLSDLHITASGELHGVVDSLATLQGVLHLLETSGLPDLLLFTGDLADKGEPAAYHRLREVVEAFGARTGVPYLYLPGNHDERRAFRRDLLGWEEN